MNGTAEQGIYIGPKQNSTWEKLLTPGKNILHKTSVDSKKILLPARNIKLALIIKALSIDGDCFKYLCGRFLHLSDGKLKEIICVRPDIHKACI